MKEKKNEVEGEEEEEEEKEEKEEKEEEEEEEEDKIDWCLCVWQCGQLVVIFLHNRYLHYLTSNTTVDALEEEQQRPDTESNNSLTLNTMLAQ